MIIRAENLSISFDGVPAVKGVSLALPQGTQLQLFGPSGGGKTTFAKALAGLIPATTGSVFWNDEAVASLSFSKKQEGMAQLGMVFQTDALFDSMTVLENVEFPLLKRKVPGPSARERAMAVLEDVSLGFAKDLLPEELSGGMKKRAGLARAIVASPSVLFADDPLAGLDPHTARAVCRVIENASKNRTLVVCCPDVISWLPDNTVYRMENGMLKAAT